ncbi:MAG TPA: tRNA (adenosine(37)-N6)-threonylcarbamoyltransferase complex ATPase subunit type 1 TsaE [Fimbriimonas sp.]
MERRRARDEAATRSAGASLARRLGPGDVVFLTGELGAGKTTFVRGLLEAMGHQGPVRSPTFNLVQTFDLALPVMHADLYRVGSWEGIGIEDYLDSHVCLIEWPDRANGLVDPGSVWNVEIAFEEEGRRITISPPGQGARRR